MKIKMGEKEKNDYAGGLAAPKHVKGEVKMLRGPRGGTSYGSLCRTLTSKSN